MPLVHSLPFGLSFVCFFMAVAVISLSAIKERHAHICLNLYWNTLKCRKPFFFCEYTSTLDIRSISFSVCFSSTSLSLLVNADWQWILVITKGQVESSHTLIQRHITPWNNPQVTFTLVSISHSNLDATFQFIHAIFWCRSVAGRLSAVCSKRRTLIRQLRMTDACSRAKRYPLEIWQTLHESSSNSEPSSCSRKNLRDKKQYSSFHLCCVCTYVGWLRFWQSTDFQQ